MCRIKEKRGISLAEAVIALAVILIVTVAALSVALTSIAVKRKTLYASYAQDFARNAYECFIAAEDEEDFVALIEFAEGAFLAEKDGKYTYVNEEKDYIATIKVDYDADRPTFSVTILNAKGEEVVPLIEYEKGGK